jgi:hypothetical protein
MLKPTNLKDGKRVAVTHGELFFQPVEKMPRGKISQHKMFVVGHSETGHHHVLESEQEFGLIDGEDRVILLKEVGKLFHQKAFDIHETQVLAPGAYKVYYKKEYNPFTKVTQRVFD